MFYQSLDVFCLPSLKEGMPLAPLEAQACGIPAVVTNTGAAWETLFSDNGGLAEPGNSQDLARLLKKLLIEKSGPNPRPFVEESGNILAMSQAYAHLYYQA